MENGYGDEDLSGLLTAGIIYGCVLFLKKAFAVEKHEDFFLPLCQCSDLDYI